MHQDRLSRLNAIESSYAAEEEAYYHEIAKKKKQLGELLREARNNSNNEAIKKLIKFEESVGQIEKIRPTQMP